MPFRFRCLYTPYFKFDNMDNLGQSLALSSISSLLLHEASEDHSTPALSNPDMSIKQQFQAMFPDIRRRRKPSRESSASSGHQQGTEPTTSGSTSSKNRTTMSAESLESSSEELLQKRRRVQNWLIHQSQRLEQLKHGLRGHRDSMFGQADIEKELKRASQNANAVVSGPDGEPIDQRVLDHFFILFPACGSDWRDSARWEFHLARCLQGQCHVCRSSQYSTKRSFPPPGSCSSTTKRSFWSGDDSLPFALLRPKAGKRKEKGKLPADPEDKLPISLFGRHGTKLQENSPRGYRRTAKQPRVNVVISAAIRRTQEKPIRCSVRKEILDPNRIPVPAVPDLKPADSSGFDLRDLTHVTGRPYDGCPLDDGCIPFPLAGNLPMPPTPELIPERCISPTPTPRCLDSSSPMYAEEGVFAMSPPASPTSSSTNLQHSHRSTIRLVEEPWMDDLRTMLDNLGHDVSKPRISHPRQPLADRSSRRQAPTAKYPPTPPGSRPHSGLSTVASNASQSGGVMPLIEPGIETRALVGRNRAVYEIADATRSSSPQCAMYTSLSEQQDRQWASTVRKTQQW